MYCSRQDSVQVVQELHLYDSSCGEFVGKIQLRNDSAFERLQMCQLCRINLLVSCFMKGILMQIETKFSVFKCFIDFKAFFHQFLVHVVKLMQNYTVLQMFIHCRFFFSYVLYVRMRVSSKKQNSNYSNSASHIYTSNIPFCTPLGSYGCWFNNDCASTNHTAEAEL